MPVMGGFEATSKIRELEAQRNTRTPIIALTAHAIQVLMTLKKKANNFSGL